MVGIATRRTGNDSNRSISARCRRRNLVGVMRRQQSGQNVQSAPDLVMPMSFAFEPVSVTP